VSLCDRLTGAKIAKIDILWYKFAQKRYTPLSNFYKIWLGKKLSGHIILQNLAIVTFKMWANSPQNRRNW